MIAFKNLGMEARWQPRDDTIVGHDLYRIKQQMRTWANKVVTDDSSLLEEGKFTDLIDDLSNVVLLDGSRIPQELLQAKNDSGVKLKYKNLLSILLNALLAHDLYTTIFRSPFFWLYKEDQEHGLDSWYSLGQQGRLASI
jgi:hypothetical protein